MEKLRGPCGSILPSIAPVMNKDVVLGSAAQSRYSKAHTGLPQGVCDALNRREDLGGLNPSDPRPGLAFDLLFDFRPPGFEKLHRDSN